MSAQIGGHSQHHFEHHQPRHELSGEIEEQHQREDRDDHPDAVGLVAIAEVLRDRAVAETVARGGDEPHRDHDAEIDADGVEEVAPDGGRAPFVGKPRPAQEGGAAGRGGGEGEGEEHGAIGATRGSEIVRVLHAALAEHADGEHGTDVEHQEQPGPGNERHELAPPPLASFRKKGRSVAANDGPSTHGLVVRFGGEARSGNVAQDVGAMSSLPVVLEQPRFVHERNAAVRPRASVPWVSPKVGCRGRHPRGDAGGTGRWRVAGGRSTARLRQLARTRARRQRDQPDAQCGAVHPGGGGEPSRHRRALPRHRGPLRQAQHLARRRVGLSGPQRQRPPRLRRRKSSCACHRCLPVTACTGERSATARPWCFARRASPTGRTATSSTARPTAMRDSLAKWFSTCKAAPAARSTQTATASSKTPEGAR